MKKRTYLIQRLCFPVKRPDGKLNKLMEVLSFGGGFIHGGLTEDAMGLLRPIFNFDYMGSAEFEWGAVPKSLNEIAHNNEQYVRGEILIKSKNTPIYYICRKEDETDVQDLIQQLAADQYRNLKERSMVKEVVDGDSYAKDRIGGWLEIDNHFFFFTDKIMFEKVAELFQIKETDKIMFEKVAELFQIKEEVK